LLIGLTGGIGSGKTAAANCFAGFGADIIDTDVISHEFTRPGGAAIAPIRTYFGEQYINADGALNREKMRALVFRDSACRKQLEAILHPLIHHATDQRIRHSTFCYAIIVVPLLFETNHYCRIARTMSRSNLDEDTVRAIMTTQVSRQERLSRADDVIENTRDIDYLRQQAGVMHQKYLDLSCNIPADLR
jgi:dephospho-CoA kinase